MKAEDASALYYKSYGEQMAWYSHSGEPVIQQQAQFKAWDVVIAAIRKHYQDENERLRAENRALREGILTQIEHDARLTHASV